MAVKIINLNPYLAAYTTFQNAEETRRANITRAIEKDDIAEIKELIDAYEEKDREDYVISTDQTFVLCETIRLAKLPFLQDLLKDKGMNICVEAKISAIDYSITNDNSQALRVLLQYIDISDKFRQKAIDNAKEEGHFACAEELARKMI